jgi:DNA-binding transcriptional LysR family regulator
VTKERSVVSIIMDDTRPVSAGRRVEGPLRLVASPTTAEHMVPGWLVSLRALRPHVRVGLRVMPSRLVLRRLREGAADLGFIESDLAPEGIQTLPVHDGRLLVVASPAHPWARQRRPISGAELAAAPLLLREAGSEVREMFARALRPWGGPCLPEREFTATRTLRAAAARGIAPAVLAALAASGDLAASRLAEVAVEDGVRLRRTLRAAWCRDRPLTGPARDLLRVASQR